MSNDEGVTLPADPADGILPVDERKTITWAFPAYLLSGRTGRPPAEPDKMPIFH